MKILLVITGLGVGGAEKVVTSLADQLVEKGHSVKLVYLLGEALVKPKSQEVELLSLGMVTSLDVFSTFFKLYKLVKFFKPDVVHSHLFHSNILCRLLRLTCKFPRLISTAHNNNEGGFLRMPIYRLTDSLTDITTNVSQVAVNTFVSQRAAPEGRILCLHNGINTNEFSCSEMSRLAIRKQLKICDKTKLILAVGRLNEPKDYPNLINAFNMMNDLTSILVIAGDGYLKKELVLLVNSLELQSRIIFLGIRHDIPQLMSAADIFVLSSAWEGFGLVVAEAMACENIVVATDCGGIKEVVGEHGLLVPIKNSTVLSQVLDAAIKMDNTAIKAIGLLARQRIINYYSINTSTEKYLKLYSCHKSNILRTFNSCD